MTTTPPPDPTTPNARQAELDAAKRLLDRMGISPADLLAESRPRVEVPTFTDCVPRVRQAVADGTRRVYGSYWNRILARWPHRRLDEISATDVRQLVEETKRNVVARRNDRDGRSAAEHLTGALRCPYRQAEDDGLVDPGANPARKVAESRRLPNTRQAVPDDRLTEIHQAAATTGDDPALDTLLLRLHVETARRRAGALALHPQDLDPDQCPVLLREKGGTVRRQPVSPTLMTHLRQHAAGRYAVRAGSCCAARRAVRSRAAATTTCGPGWAPGCRGWPRSRSRRTGCGTRR